MQSFAMTRDRRRSTGSRFQLNVTAGSQKRAIANLRKSKGRDESRFALKLKRNLDFNCKSRSLSIFCHYWDKHCHYWDNQFVWAFSRCVENDSPRVDLRKMKIKFLPLPKRRRRLISPLTAASYPNQAMEIDP